MNKVSFDRLLCLCFKKFALLFILLPFLLTRLYGQAPTEASAPSPNASSLGKYGDIPVSYHTGVPNINIPLYTVKEGPLSLPISLSYHASGIRVDEIASWVGLGWSLNAGGMITRVVRGAPDEGCYYLNYGVDPSINSGSCSADPNYNGSYSLGGCTPQVIDCAGKYQSAMNGIIDAEPYMYTFNFSGYAGKFFFDANRTPHMIPEGDLRIEPSWTNGAFVNWKITTPDGTMYYFGDYNSISGTENTYAGVPNQSQGLRLASTTWYLTQVASADGANKINLN